MIVSDFFLATRFDAANPVSAVPNFAANTAWPVQTADGTATSHLHDDLTAFRVANITLGKLYFLTRGVLNATTQPLANVKFGNIEVNPTLIDNPATAVPLLEIEAEGGDTDADGLATYLKTSSTGAIDGNTAAGTPLTIVAGQWATITNVATQPRCGQLVKQLSPYTTGNIRIAIEVCEPVFDKIV